MYMCIQKISPVFFLTLFHMLHGNNDYQPEGLCFFLHHVFLKMCNVLLRIILYLYIVPVVLFQLLRVVSHIYSRFCIIVKFFNNC